jgi:PAS domain-containing protein
VFDLMDQLSSSGAGLDFYAIFDAAPTPYLILTPALIIAAVNEAYLQVTQRLREELIGRCIFDAFPDNPNDSSANGVEKLRKSLERVLSYRVRDTTGVQPYDIPAGDLAEGRFEERYWSPINTAVLDAQGMLTHIIHRVENVTELVQTRTLAFPGLVCVLTRCGGYFGQLNGGGSLFRKAATALRWYSEERATP